jgi:hypothetical protein
LLAELGGFDLHGHGAIAPLNLELESIPNFGVFNLDLQGIGTANGDALYLQNHIASA